MELFVVIVIMTILSAILLPALKGGRARSQTISCMNNLRQLQIGWQMYADDNLSTFAENNWVHNIKVGSFAPLEGNSWCVGDATVDTDAQNIKKGELFPYNNSAGIYRCPADSATVDGSPVSKAPRTRSYSMSASVGCSVSSPAWNPRSYLKFSETINPPLSRLFVFVDAHKDTIRDSHFAQFSEDKKWIDLPSDRHDNRAANFSFADGHIERVKWLAPKVFTEWHQRAVGDDIIDQTEVRKKMFAQ